MIIRVECGDEPVHGFLLVTDRNRCWESFHFWDNYLYGKDRLSVLMQYPLCQFVKLLSTS